MSSAPKSRRSLRRAAIIAGSIVLAAVTVLALAELGLRAAEWVLLSGRDDGPAAGSASILCVGDSWTYGVESEDPARHSYPAQLQRLVDERVGRYRYRVINRGRPGLNSRLLRQRLLTQLKRFRPSVVVVLVGGTNFYNAGQELSGDAEAELSWWRRLKVVRIWGVLSSPKQAPRQPLAQGLKAGDVRTDLVTAVSRPKVQGEFRDDAQGIPLASETGCSGAGDAAGLMAAVHGAAGKSTAEVAAVLARAPGCTRLMVHAADLCFARRNFDCARRFANQALKKEPQEPRATVVLAAVQHHLKQPLAKETLAQLEHVTAAHPRYMRARRLKSLALLLGKVTLCELKRELTAANKACPRCGWVKAAMKVFEKEVQTPGARTLRQDLSAIHHLCKMRRAKLLLLNYPQSDRDVCGHMAQEVNAAFAHKHKVPIIEIGQILGPLSTTKKSPFYGAQDHPNTKGYGLLARKVLDRLTTLGWVTKAEKKGKGKGR